MDDLSFLGKVKCVRACVCVCVIDSISIVRGVLTEMII